MCKKKSLVFLGYSLSSLEVICLFVVFPLYCSSLLFIFSCHIRTGNYHASLLNSTRDVHTCPLLSLIFSSLCARGLHPLFSTFHSSYLHLFHWISLLILPPFKPHLFLTVCLWATWWALTPASVSPPHIHKLQKEQPNEQSLGSSTDKRIQTHLEHKKETSEINMHYIYTYVYVMTGTHSHIHKHTCRSHEVCEQMICLAVRANRLSLEHWQPYPCHY